MENQQSIAVSVYVITLNEEVNLPRLLAGLQDFDEVIIVDSGSTDATLALASACPNVKISYHPFTGFASQKSHALSLCSNEWVLNLDADESLTPEFLAVLRSVISDDGVDALRCTRTLLRWGRKPKSFSKSERLIRLFRKPCGFYDDRLVHECIHVEGSIRETDTAILHHEDLTFARRIEKSNFYAHLKSQDKFKRGDQIRILVPLLAFPLSFLRTYFIKGHCLDGFGGVLTSVNVAFYQFMKYANLWEMNQIKNRLRKQQEAGKLNQEGELDLYQRL